MKIVYFYLYFSTPNGSWGTRVYEFAREWVKSGHEVTVISGVYSKSDITAKKLVEDKYFEGIHVKIVNVKIDNKQPIFRRVWSFIKYSLVSTYYALTLKADIVIASSGPITVGIPGLVAKYFRGRKLVFETRDLWPEGAIELGIIKNYLIKRLCYWFEKKCYDAASFIVTLSPGMSQNIRKRFGITKVDDVTNAANIDLFSTPTSINELNFERKCYAIYTGNIGMVNNSYWLFEAAKELKRLGRTDIKIVLIGEGQQKKELEELAQGECLDNFICLGLMPKHKLVAYLQNSFVSLVPLKGTPILDTSSPNKFFESLAAGIPVIQNTQGWMKDFIDRYNLGYTLSPDNAAQLAEKLIQMKDDPVSTTHMGERSLKIAKTYFDKNYLAKKMLTILENVQGTK